MIKKCILMIMSTSLNEDTIKVAINDFIHHGFANYKITKNEIGEGALFIITFATTYDASFIKERLLDTGFPYFFLVNVMENDDNFDYFFGENVIIDDLEEINEGLVIKKHQDIVDYDGYKDVIGQHLQNLGDLSNIAYTFHSTLTQPLQYLDVTFGIDNNNLGFDDKDYTLDELIDIINEKGVENLTDRQKECLKKYND